MRSFVRRTIIVSTCLSAAIVAVGCEAKQATEYVSGISTQVSVPRDLKAIRVQITVGGAPQWCQGYRVFEGKVQLPRSLGTFPNSDRSIFSGPLTYSIAGLTTEDLDADFFSNCFPAKVNTENVRILRRSRQPYIKDEILFLPMPLKYSCYDKQCDDKDGVEMTCKGGKCVNAQALYECAESDAACLTKQKADALKLFPRYNPDLVDGTGGTCFHKEECMAAAAPAIVVDANNCTYAVPNTPSVPELASGAVSPFPPIESGQGVNVEVIYDGGLVAEVLDADLEEGFSLPDPANPQRFKLADGLCEMVKGIDSEGKATAHRITAIRTSGSCRAKLLPQPLCASDQVKSMGLNVDGKLTDPPPASVCTATELKPPRAALMVVVDNTKGHSNFFNGEQIAGLQFPLQDPAFAQTDIGLMYAPGTPLCGVSNPPEIKFEPALLAREHIVEKFGAIASNLGLLDQVNPVAFEGALISSYKLLTALPNETYFRRAVVVLGNREFNKDGCAANPGTPATLASEARLGTAEPTKPINTYVIQLVNNPAAPSNEFEVGALELGAAGSAIGAADARKDKSTALSAFREVVNALATCTYDIPDAAALGPQDFVSFSDPLTDKATKAGFKADCSAPDGNGSGWGYAASGAPPGKKRIHLCAETCGTYREVRRGASVFPLLWNPPSPPIPVPIFGYKGADGTTCPSGPPQP